MLTTNEIIAAIRRKILEETTELVTDSTILMNINLAYDDLRYSTYTNDQIQTATISFTNGSGTLPTHFGTLYTDPQDSNGNVFQELSIADFDREPQERAVKIEGGVMKVVPITTASLVVKYYPSYTALSTSQNPEIHEMFHELIIYGALYRIYEDLQDEELALNYEAKYSKKFDKKTDVVSAYQEGPQQGGSLFNGIRII